MPMGLGTRAHELALYVVLESPLQMVSDYPEHYAGQHDFEFIKQVPTTWDEVRVLDGRPMENITVARRSGKDWYVGSITNWDERTVKMPLSFLGEGKYVAEIYADAPDATVTRLILPSQNSPLTVTLFWMFGWSQGEATPSGSTRGVAKGHSVPTVPVAFTQINRL